mgnify:FL=1
MLFIRNLIIKANTKNLLKIPELNLEYPERILVFGRNSSGKSILLETLNSDYRNYEGKIEFKVKKSLFQQKETKPKIKMINNNCQLDIHKPIFTNFTAKFGTIDKKKKNKINSILSFFNYSKPETTIISTLSNSQKKLIELIIVILSNPHIILFDDIDNYFDKLNLRRILNFIKTEVDNNFIFLATAKEKIDNFDRIYRIQNKEVVKI